MSHPGTLPLRLYRGDSYAWRVQLWQDEAHTEAIPLDGVTADARIDGCDGSVIELDCTVTLPNLIDVVLPAANWNGAAFNCGGTAKPNRWDLQLTWLADGQVFTLLGGPVTVSDDVTP